MAIQIPTHFANLCDGVIAPSESLARVIRRRGVTAPIAVIPTGIDVKAFAVGEMGEADKPVEIVFWNASWQSEVDGRGDTIKALCHAFAMSAETTMERRRCSKARATRLRVAVSVSRTAYSN